MLWYWSSAWHGLWLFPLLGFLLMLGMMFVMARFGCHGMCMPMGPGRSRRDSARDILDRRYASGEIGAEEYRRMRAEIGG